MFGFSVNFRTPPPTTDAQNYSREQALEIAAQTLADNHLVPEDAPVIKEKVLQPNDFWLPGGKKTDQGPEDTLPIARVAWSVRYIVNQRYWFVYVDAATGQVIGGLAYGYR